MNILRRLLFMLISIFFILSNLLFYTINFKEYVNFRIFQITSTLLVSEVFFFFWYSINIRNAWLIIISILNFFNAVIVWLDFDTVPSTLIRVGVGALSIGYLFFVRKSVTEDEDNEEEKDDSNDDEYYEIEYSDIKRIEEK